MKKIIGILLVCGLTLCMTVQGQAVQSNWVKYPETFGSNVYGVLSDQFGYIWVATYNGLMRYDGYEFHRYYYNPLDSGSLKDIVSTALFEDHQGNIWIGGVLSINKFNRAKGTFTRYSIANLGDSFSIYQAGVVSIGEGADGKIYFGVISTFGAPIGGGLLYYDSASDKIKKVEGLDFLHISAVPSLTSDPNGNIWFASKNGVYEIRPHHKPEGPILIPDKGSSHNFAAIASDPSGTLWVSFGNSTLQAYDPKTRQITSFGIPGSGPHQPKAPIIQVLCPDPTGGIWIGTNDGLYYFNKIKGSIDPIEVEDGERQPLNIMSLNRDHFGNVWIGTYGGGLYKYKKREILKSYSHLKGDSSSILPGWASSLTESQDGKIWMGIGAGRSGISVLDPKTGTFQNYFVNEYMVRHSAVLPILGLYEYSKGRFYYCSVNDIYDFSPDSHTFKKIILPGLYKNPMVNQFYKDHFGNLWALTTKGPFERPSGSDSFHKIDFSHLPGIDDNSVYVTHCFESRRDGMWFLTNNGLFLFDYKTGKVQRKGFDPKLGDVLPSQDINSFYEGPDGIAWVGTWQGGLCRYDVDKNTIKTYTIQDGLPSMSIQGILYDRKDSMLWLSTFNGISRFNIQRQEFYNFTLADGIQGLLYADGAYLETSGGQFVFGGENGVNVFDPHEMIKNSLPPRVYITDLKVNNRSVIMPSAGIFKKPLYETREITLNYDQNNLEIDFIGIHYTNPSENKYAYELENFDNGYREVVNQRTAFYSNLPPGKYTFRVRAANSSGIWNNQGATLIIIITPPWWRTNLAYGLYVMGFLLLLWMFISIRSRQLKKENLLLEKRVALRTQQLNQSLQDLKATQAQLIQSEKMASLGELTAGIAHEIQNPLNFVNNFSELNNELLGEMKEELDKGNIEAAKNLAADTVQNGEKILHHGKRAEGIVKGMLQHSRTGNGQLEDTDLNSLCDEYLRLSYHGLRARDKGFNAEMDTDFDPDIGTVPLVTQDIGRVLLNLVNNAFYAVADRQKQETENYQPRVSVLTRKTGDQVEIRVKDNGSGIPEKLVDKIFQPFFTTKPTGSGTGLGLSLSYDIIKAHGGTIRVSSEQGKGTEFVITLPLKQGGAT
ncbi:MAG: hypothetical protein KGM98_11555 [Bacteroidota bacterium]|nr:hypothetical protein [Bacteroidota bacterium]